MKNKIVEAVGVSANARNDGDRGRAKAVQEAMSQAVTDAWVEGISDPVVHHERMMAARERVMAEFAKRAE